MSFDAIIGDIVERLKAAPLVRNERWQSVAAPMDTYELLNYSFALMLPGEDLDWYRREIQPNLPWADRHFELERVSGDPVNPGATWREWPYARSADRHRREGEEDPQFDHSYAERYWPKHAGRTPGGILLEDPKSEGHRGYRFPYGDLDDLVDVLAGEPTTRQAYLPVWFPEDLGAAKLGKRVPCSLGYHFIMREDRLHIIYYLRSCDFVRHFRDDVYLTIRLLLWVLGQCRLARPENDWARVVPGTLTMHVTSLHMFESDKRLFR